MPNLDAPNGFSPVRHLKGGTVRYAGGYSIASAYGTNIFLGDIVKLAAVLNDNNIEAAAAGDLFLGVFAGCQYTAADGEVKWSKQWIANTVTQGGVDAEAFVFVDPDVLYAVQVNGTLSGLDAIGEFADLDASVAGNAATGVSGMQLSATSAGTTAQFRIHAAATNPDGIYSTDLLAANPRVLVQFNEQSLTANLLAT